MGPPKAAYPTQGVTLCNKIFLFFTTRDSNVKGGSGLLVPRPSSRRRQAMQWGADFVNTAAIALRPETCLLPEDAMRSSPTAIRYLPPVLFKYYLKGWAKVRARVVIRREGFPCCREGMLRSVGKH